MSSTALTYFQAGIESTRGTAVAATKKIHALGGLPKEENNLFHVQQSRANWIKNQDAISTHRGIPSWGLELPAVAYDVLPWWLHLCLQGNVSAAGGPVYTWTFNDATTTDTLESATFEADDDAESWQIPFCMVNSWELSGKGGSGMTPVSAKFDLIGQQLTGGHTMTGSLTDADHEGNYLAFKNADLYIDDTAGGIGTTKISAALTEFSIKCANNLEPVWTGGSQYYSHVERAERAIEFMAVLKFNATMLAEFKNKYQADTARYLQLAIPGSGNLDFDFTMHTVMNTYEFKDEGAERRVAIMGESIYDATLGYGGQIVIANDSNTL